MTQAIGIACEQDFTGPGVNRKGRKLDFGRRQLNASCTYGKNQHQADQYAAKGRQRHLQFSPEADGVRSVYPFLCCSATEIGINFLKVRLQLLILGRRKPIAAQQFRPNVITIL
jgi:hypothetical protein